MPLLDVMRKKLREAHYFLHQMQTVSQREVGDPEEFEFLLSAFLSASISITDPLDSRRYRAWFEAWRKTRTPQEPELLEFMRVQRIAEVHRDGADVDVTVHFVPVTKVRYSGQGHPAHYGFQWWGPPDVPPPTVGVNVHHFQLGSTQVEALDTCRAFGELLHELVSTFEVAYPGA